jgi:excinuclease ABC subunit A
VCSARNYRACGSAVFSGCAINGEIKLLDDPKVLPTGAGTRELAVDVVVDRLVANADQRSRIADSLELAFREGHDRASVLAQKTSEDPWRELTLSQSLACEVCGDVFEKLTGRHFRSVIGRAHVQPATASGANCASCPS